MANKDLEWAVVQADTCLEKAYKHIENGDTSKAKREISNARNHLQVQSRMREVPHEQDEE